MRFFLAAFMCAVAAQRASTSTSTLTFTLPRALAAEYEDGGVPNSQAMFGSPNYGSESSINGQLVYAAGDRNGCTEFSKADVPNWPIQPGIPVIVMVDRGNCTFVTKVRHAQDAGAFAAIIIDNKDEEGLPLMADDGSGGDIRIPSILIHKDDGANIQTFMISKVNAQITWNLPHPDGRVEWDFWTSSDDQSSTTFKQQFRRVSVSLGTHAKLTPHYFFIDGRYAGCEPGSQIPACKLQCINDGRYCATDPEQDITRGISGAQVAEENLRQMCLWTVHLDDDADPAIWFDYVTAFERDCNTPSTWGKACSDGIIAALGLDTVAVAQCVANSTETDTGVNLLIEGELQLKDENGIFFNPTILVNNIPFRGALSCPDPIKTKTCGVLSAICDGFAQDTAPQTCVTTDCELGQVRDECGVCGGTGRRDACGLCFQDSTNQAFNQSCAGCDGVPNSGLALDNCGVCNGPGHDMCGECFPLGDPKRIDEGSGKHCVVGGFPVVAIVAIVLGIVLVGGVGVVVLWNRRERATRADIDSLLKQYMPMEAENANLNRASARA